MDDTARGANEVMGKVYDKLVEASQYLTIGDPLAQPISDAIDSLAGWLGRPTVMMNWPSYTELPRTIYYAAGTGRGPLYLALRGVKSALKTSRVAEYARFDGSPVDKRVWRGRVTWVPIDIDKEKDSYGRIALRPARSNQK